MFDGDFDHGAEVVVVLAADGAVAGVDAVFGEGLGSVRIFGEEEVSVVVEVTDDGGVPALGADSLNDIGNGLGGFVVVNGDANHLRAGAREGGDLLDGAVDVGGIGVGHRLDDDGGVGADADIADGDRNGFPAVNGWHTPSVYQFRGVDSGFRLWEADGNVAVAVGDGLGGDFVAIIFQFKEFARFGKRE
jgi:hypothetical protein